MERLSENNGSPDSAGTWREKDFNASHNFINDAMNHLKNTWSHVAELNATPSEYAEALCETAVGLGAMAAGPKLVTALRGEALTPPFIEGGVGAADQLIPGFCTDYPSATSELIGMGGLRGPGLRPVWNSPSVHFTDFPSTMPDVLGYGGTKSTGISPRWEPKSLVVKISATPERLTSEEQLSKTESTVTAVQSKSEADAVPLISEDEASKLGRVLENINAKSAKPSRETMQLVDAYNEHLTATAHLFDKQLFWPAKGEIPKIPEFARGAYLRATGKMPADNPAFIHRDLQYMEELRELPADHPIVQQMNAWQRGRMLLRGVRDSYSADTKLA